VKILKVFLHPPLGKRKLIRIVEFTIANVTILSIPKMNCENYLFEDYRWKSGIPIWILALMISAYYKGVGKDMVITIC